MYTLIFNISADFNEIVTEAHLKVAFMRHYTLKRQIVY